MAAGGAARRSSATGYVAPGTPTEHCLARAWAELLDLDRVGRDDNLFALGAHSLLVTRFVARVREELQVELPLRALFDRPTIGDLAVAIVSLERTPGLTDRIATLLEELASMSDEELRAEAQPLDRIAAFASVGQIAARFSTLVFVVAPIFVDESFACMNSNR